MAYSNSPDSEFDPEMERVLREHFDAESSNLRSPNDPWPWLESRMEESMTTSLLSRVLGWLNPMRNGRLSPAFAVAGVAVVAALVAAVVWAVSGVGGPEAPGGLAVAPGVTATPTTAPASTNAPYPTAFPGVTTGPPGGPGAQGAQGSDGADGESSTAATAPTTSPAMAQAPTPGATTVPYATAAPAPTEAPTMAEAATAAPAPHPTTAPAAAASSHAAPTPAPTMMASSLPPQQGAMSGAQGAAGSPPDTTFRDYRRQPFVAAAEDNVSTFSLDTDRTSFQLALNWARAGYEVNPDSVRAEEWVNAFDYGYVKPGRKDDFNIYTGLFPHPLDENKRLARIAFQSPEVVDDKPLNVTLVLDASGSMADGNRVDIARAAAESIRRSLRDDDRIAVVHFTDDVIHQYTVEHRRPGDSRVTDSIAWLQPHGSTNVQAGLNLGVMLADDARERRPDAYNYVILMSDGVANVDATDPFAILETAYDANARNPLRLITVGVGINNYNDVLLEQLAQHGNGWYRYLNDTVQAEATFSRDNWLALSTPVADHTRAQVTWNPETVERWRIIGYENRVTAAENFVQDRKEFAELYSGAATTVFFELELQEDAPSRGLVDLGELRLAWSNPETGYSTEYHKFLRESVTGFEGAMGHLGAIAALSADRYSALPYAGEDGLRLSAADIHRDLSTLLSQLRGLRPELSGLDAYKDFLFLLEHITGSVAERAPPSTPSGYSR